MKKADFSAETAHTGSSAYPPPFDQQVKGRKSWGVNRQFGLKQFGVNRVEIPPGGWSTQKHWHKSNDECVIVISGEIVAVTDEGEVTLKAGDCIGFKAGVQNAHHLQNRSAEPAVFFDVGGRDPWDVSVFPDMGLEGRTHMQLQFKPLKPKE